MEYTAWCIFTVRKIFKPMRIALILFIVCISACNYQQPEPLEVVTPKSVATVQPPDSTQFLILIGNKTLAVTLAGKSETIEGISGLDKFIADHKLTIDKKRIAVLTDSTSNLKLLDSIAKVLSNHNYYKFTMITR